MDPANADEALLEVALDLSEGADMNHGQNLACPISILFRQVKDTFAVPTLVSPGQR